MPRSDRLSWAELLQDPRWEAVRESVLARDGHSCLTCGSTDRLQVHHGYYEYGLPPWAYDHESLWTLCEDCHRLADTDRRELKKLLRYLSPSEVERLVHSLATLSSSAPESIGEVIRDLRLANRVNRLTRSAS